MSYTVLEFRTREALVAQGTAAVRDAVVAGDAVELIVPSRAWVEPRKLQIMEAGLGGVNVQTLANWLDGVWDRFGDGTRIVSSVQRRLLARPLLAEMFEAPPSASLLDEFCMFLEEASGAAARCDENLTEVERKLVALACRYTEALRGLGLVELADVQAVVLENRLPVGVVVVEEPSPSARDARFLQELGCFCPVTVLQRSVLAHDGVSGVAGAPEELAALSETLFSGRGGVPAQGSVVAGEAHGAHIEGELIAAIVEQLELHGARPEDLSVVFSNPAESYPHVQDALVRAGIPFSCSCKVPCGSTSLGTAFMNLMYLREGADDKALYLALADLAASAYAGISGADARALQMRWRARATSTHAQRLDDIANGFAQGNADAKLVRSRLEPLSGLLGAPLAEAVRMMFEHARTARGALAPALVDDARAADAILDYLEEVAAIGMRPDSDDIARLAVTCERAYGARADEETAAVEGVQLVGSEALVLQERPYVVLANLDAAHHPMAQTAGAFDVLLQKLGLGRLDTQALHERCLLLDAIGSARRGFAFYRVCHDREGAESCQSALWDELVSAYTTPADAGNEVAQLPHALEDARMVVRMSEAQVFEHKAAGRSVRLSRGALADERMNRQLAQYNSGDAIPFSPTALEDYYRCPYRWFASRRVGYNGMDNAFTASAQGNLAHAVFDAFYRKLRQAGHARVTHDNLEEAVALAGAVFDEQLERGMDKPRTGLFLRTQMDRLACEEIRGQVLAFVERDADFLPGFEPTYFELELGRGTGSTLMYGGVPVRGKVDRVDVDARGRAVVVDYKLSKLNAGYGLDGSGGLPGRIQTDIYAVLVQRHLELLGEDVHVVGSVYRSYSGNMLRGVYAEGIDWGVRENARPDKDALPGSGMGMPYDEYLGLVEREVSQCVERLVAGDIEPRPRGKGVCEYCRALAFCPRREA